MSLRNGQRRKIYSRKGRNNSSVKAEPGSSRVVIPAPANDSGSSVCFTEDYFGTFQRSILFQRSSSSHIFDKYTNVFLGIYLNV